MYGLVSFAGSTRVLNANLRFPSARARLGVIRQIGLRYDRSEITQPRLLWLGDLRCEEGATQFSHLINSKFAFNQFITKQCEDSATDEEWAGVAVPVHTGSATVIIC